MRPVPSTLVAREFHGLSKAEGVRRTPLELIKLTYLAHGWSFAILKGPLVDEPVEAWQYGPVFPKLYHALKAYGQSPVEIVPKCYREQTEQGICLESEERDLVKDVYETYKHLNGPQLIDLTHKKGSPWSKTWKFLNREIKPEVISEYYINKKKERDNESGRTQAVA